MNEKEKLRIKEKKKLVLRVFSRISTTLICTITAILLPGFGKVMAFLGSFSAFLICIILPVSLCLVLFCLVLFSLVLVLVIICQEEKELIPIQLLFHLRLSPSMFGDSQSQTQTQTQLDRVGHWIMVGISVILMIAGTGWAFIPGSGHGGLDDGR
jgi:vesicular inhibitory amino acid transporter